jgi:hypothetical protein
MNFNKLVIDSSSSKTELCKLGEIYPTDKSPYNTGSSSGHRHAYTAIYDLIFSSMKFKDINFGEIGIEFNKSILCWRNYFKKANIYTWEYDQEKIKLALNDKLDVVYNTIDVRDIISIDNSLKNTNIMFDILIDDSTHVFSDQINVIKVAYKYLNTGGILIIEDIFKNIEELKYKNEIGEYLEYYDSITFIDAEHKNRNSYGWDNDKLLILVRNNKIVK